MKVLIKDFSHKVLFSGEWPFGAKIADRIRIDGGTYAVFDSEYRYSSVAKEWTLFIRVRNANNN